MRRSYQSPQPLTPVIPATPPVYTESVKSLAAKTILGFTQLVLILALALFAPAFTLRYWQAWLYLFLFAAASATITLCLWNHDKALLERRVNAGPNAEATRSQQIIQIFASLAFLAILIVPSLDHRFSWSRVPFTVVLSGDLLVVFGFYCVYRVFRVNTFTAGTIQVAENQTVISTGPYALVRHPMYSGAFVMLLGTPLALASWWGLAAFPPIFAAIVARLLDEETFLHKNLPGYCDYTAKVKYRLLPFLW